MYLIKDITFHLMAYCDILICHLLKFLARVLKINSFHAMHLHHQISLVWADKERGQIEIKYSKTCFILALLYSTINQFNVIKAPSLCLSLYLSLCLSVSLSKHHNMYIYIYM